MGISGVSQLLGLEIPVSIVVGLSLSPNSKSKRGTSKNTCRTLRREEIPAANARSVDESP